MKIENRKVKIIIAVIVIALCAICFYAYYYNKTPNNMKSLEEVASQEVDLEKEIQSVEWEHAEYDYPAMIMVQDVLYYDSGEISTEARCGMMDGEITTMAEPVPSENDQSNFGIGYGYQYGTENTIDVCMDDGWHTFVLYEKEKFDEVDKLIEQKTEEEFSFAEFRTWKFEFLSGAGGWATYLTIEEDGSFFGEFFDGELGITGEDYPNGTMYQCHFQGRFTQPIKVNEFTYSMKIAEISYENEPGTEEIINGMRYCYATPYGLEGAEDILIYTPKAPLSELSEEYRSWVRYLDHSETGATELSFGAYTM